MQILRKVWRLPTSTHGLSHSTDIQNKANQNNFAKSTQKNADVKLCHSQNCYHYRNKLNFAIFHNTLCFADIDENFFPVENCPLFVRDISDIIDVVNDYLASTKNEFRAFHIRLLDGVYQFTFVSNSYEFPHSQQLISKFLQKNIKFSLNLCKNTQKNSSNITEDVICLYGEANQVYDVLGIKSKVSPASFLQVNKDVQNKIYHDINTLIEPNAKVINAYGGTGILAAMMARKAQIVYSVELNRMASKNCRDMINKNNIKNIIAVCGDCQNEIPKILQKNKITHIVFDPPRNGINKTILELVSSLEIKNIIYLSCNPSSLARDLETLSDKYEIILIQPYDMFPQTHHVETLVTLRLKTKK